MHDPFRFRLPVSSALRWALAATIFALFFACHSNHSSPTQPVINPPPTPMGPGPTPTPSAAMQTVNVGQGGNAFVDQKSGNSTTTIRAGQTVQWVWVGGSHSSTSGNCCSPDGNWDSGIMSSGAFSHTFSSAGNFPYYCTVHGAAMTGMVAVTP